ncbi:uncharacterized protein LOC141617235 [Silene latifolia]|uniref:uncharacterized protein LOC141617235 n=1 Tax=Silene latifolia TaxID=37657 RepID=UPI003D77A16F
MGFRDFRLFNLALLGKQAWRLITNPTSLWTRIMKARYFPEGEFMNATLGYNPSYTWRNILEARPVLEKGLRGRIGDGMDTYIWKHAWILNSHTGRVISPCGPGNEGMRVGELLSPNGIDWDEEKLNFFFLPFERERIKNIQISPNRPSDIWFWGLEKDGVYTVRSAYRRDCGVAKWVWDGLGVDGPMDGCASDVKEWVEACWKDIGETECVKMMVGCWATWEHRNRVIFDNITVEPNFIVTRAKDVIHEGVGECDGEVKDRGRAAGSRVRGEQGEGWRKPRDGYVKLNVDASVKEGEGTTTGVVCRDAGGEVLWGMSIGREQQWEVHIAEACAVLDDLEEAARRGIQFLEVESDCLQVIEAIKGKQTERSMFSLLIEDILACSSQFKSVYWLHVSRSNSCVAHALAHCTPRVLGRILWDDGLPLSTNAAVRFDRLSN